MNRLIKTMFDNRGYSDDYIQKINDSSHGLLQNIDFLCERLDNIYKNGRHIVIIPDFDMDGIASGALGLAGLSELGFYVSLYVPDPKMGYGFGADVAQIIKTQFPNVSAVITCDVGISCFKGVEALKAAGIEVLVTDHHMPAGYNVNADCIVDPMQHGESYAHPAICGAYVLYQVLERYADRYRTVYYQEQIRRLRVFAGIGTISDSMPLLYENRGIVSDAVSILKLAYGFGDNDKFPFFSGSPLYLKVFKGLHDLVNFLNPSVIDENLIGFYIAPMFNSVKRMEGDLCKAFDVFFSDDPIYAIEYLASLNELRKRTVAEYFEKLDVSDSELVYVSDAPKGIVGLLAQNIR